jgi:hypothetical protein
MKHLKHTSKTLAKIHKKQLKIIANICNVQIKHLKRMCEMYATFINTLATICPKTQMKH